MFWLKLSFKQTSSSLHTNWLFYKSIEKLHKKYLSNFYIYCIFHHHFSSYGVSTGIVSNRSGWVGSVRRKREHEKWKCFSLGSNDRFRSQLVSTVGFFLIFLSLSLKFDFKGNNMCGGNLDEMKFETTIS